MLQFLTSGGISVTLVHLEDMCWISQKYKTIKQFDEIRKKKPHESTWGTYNDSVTWFGTGTL